MSVGIYMYIAWAHHGTVSCITLYWYAITNYVKAYYICRF